MSTLNPVRDDHLRDSMSARPSMTPHGLDPHPDVIFQDHMTSNLIGPGTKFECLVGQMKMYQAVPEDLV